MRKTDSEFNRVRKRCLDNKVLFEDGDFAAVTESIYFNQSPVPQDVVIEWRRPTEFVKNARFIVDERRCFGLSGGRLASCLAALYDFRGLFYRTVPADQDFTAQLHYAGIFHFRFWWRAEWVEVIVDDRLPINAANGHLLFLHSTSMDQFWPALLQKAYAKLHGSYEALQYASVTDILSELSGGSTELIAPLRLSLNTLHHLSTTTAFGLASIQDIASDEAKNNDSNSKLYGILGIDQILLENGTVSLIHLRQPPPGQETSLEGEWISPQSPMWNQLSVTQQNELQVAKGVARGEFWMTFGEFESNFSSVYLVYFDGDTCKSEERLRQARPFQVRSLEARWRRGISVGGCRNHIDTFHVNPQILISLSTKDLVLISIIQDQVHQPLVVGFSLYALDNNATMDVLPNSFFRSRKAQSHSTYSNTRQLVQRHELNAGQYVIVPSTFDCGQEGIFTLRVYSITPIKICQLDANPSIIKSPLIESPDRLREYQGLFLSFADEKRTINCYELQELLHSCLPNDYMKSSASLEVCRRVVQAFQTDNGDGRLGYEQFRHFICSLKAWQEVFSSYAKNTSGVMKGECVRESLKDVGIQMNTDTLQLIALKYMRRDGTLRFGDFVASILHLIVAFDTFSRRDTAKAGVIKITTNDWLKSLLRC